MRIRILVIVAALAFPALGMASPLAEAPADTQHAAGVIARTVSQLTGIPSRMRGPVRVDPGIGGGMVTWAGEVRLDPGYAHEGAEISPAYGRDYLLSHEVMHTISPRTTAEIYDAWPGWEEGVAEGMRRVLQPQIFAALGYRPADITYALWAIGDTDAREGVMYGGYLAHLERARHIFGFDAFTYYRALIGVPVQSRRQMFRSWIRQRATTLRGRDLLFVRQMMSPRSVMSERHYT